MPCVSISVIFFHCFNPFLTSSFKISVLPLFAEPVEKNICSY